MAEEEPTVEQEQRLAAAAKENEIPEDVQRLSEQILADIRTVDARDDKRVRDWVNDPENLSAAGTGSDLAYYTRLLEEQRAAQAERTEQQSRGGEVGEFLQRERARIAEVQGVGNQIDPHDVPVFEAYLNGRRDSYNDFREHALTADPSLAPDLPAAIEVNEIRIQQEVVRQEEKQDQSLSLAR